MPNILTVFEYNFFISSFYRTLFLKEINIVKKWSQPTSRLKFQLLCLVTGFEKILSER